MSISIYRTPQYSDAEFEVEVDADTVTIGSTTYDLSDLAEGERRELDSPYVIGPAFRLEGQIHIKVVQPYSGDDEPIADQPMPAAPPVPSAPAPMRPALFATLGLTITDGALTSVEMAAQLQGAYYEPGYLQVGFVDGRIPPNYLVFVQCDTRPASLTQYKGEDGFELVFADANGDPVNPGRLDIQILEVR